MSNASDFVIEKGVLRKYIGKGGAVGVPDGVQKLDFYAFRGNTKITSVTIPDSVRKLGSFEGCTALTSLTIPEGVKQLSSYQSYPW